MNIECYEFMKIIWACGSLDVVGGIREYHFMFHCERIK